MKKQLLIALITILGFIGVGLNKAYADLADDIQTVLSNLGPCEDVFSHLDTETMRECPKGVSCANFQVEVTPVEEGDESFCRLEGSSDFDKKLATEEILVGIRLDRSYPDRLISMGGPVEIANDNSSFTYEVHNSDAFARYDHLELRFMLSTTFTIKRINVTRITINPSFIEELLAGGDDDADGAGGGGGEGGGAGDGAGGGGGGGGGDAPGGDVSEDEGGGDEVAGGGGGGGGGGGAAGEGPLFDPAADLEDETNTDSTLPGVTVRADIPTATIPDQTNETGGGNCQLNPSASPQGLVFGFGWFGLVGLVLTSFRRGKNGDLR